MLAAWLIGLGSLTGDLVDSPCELFGFLIAIHSTPIYLFPEMCQERCVSPTLEGSRGRDYLFTFYIALFA